VNTVKYPRVPQNAGTFLPILTYQAFQESLSYMELFSYLVSKLASLFVCKFSPELQQVVPSMCASKLNIKAM